VTLLALKVLASIAALAFVWLPGIAWFAQREHARATGSAAPGPFHPLAEGWKLVTKNDVVPVGGDPLLHRAAPVLCFVAALLPVAVIPFAASHAIGASRVSPVIADLDWGLLLVVMAGLLRVLGQLVAGFASPEDSARLGALRAAGQALSVELALALSLTGMVLLAGSLHLGEVVAYQDQSLRALAWLEPLPGWHPLPASIAWLKIPSWGIVLQPFGFVFFLLAALARQQRLPFDGPRSTPGLAAGHQGAYSGASLAVLRAAELLEFWVVAALAATFFLGGGAIPYLSQSTITSFVAQAFGEGFASGLSLLLQVASFFVKVALLVVVQIAWQRGASRLRPSQARALGWSRILPLSMLNLAVTAVVVLGAPAFVTALAAALGAAP